MDSIRCGLHGHGSGKHKRKVCLVLDRDPHRYRKFISDIAGQDPSSHDGKVERAINVVRNFLRDLTTEAVPGGEKMIDTVVSLPGFLRSAASLDQKSTI